MTITKKTKLATAFALAAALVGYVAHNTKPAVGTVMKDSTVYAGSSPTTGKGMYTTRGDSPLGERVTPMTFHSNAQTYCELYSDMNLDSHKDWRLPDKAELNVLFRNRAAIRGFRHDALWSSSRDGNKAWGQDFETGKQAELPVGRFAEDEAKSMNIPDFHLGWDRDGENFSIALGTRCVRP